MSISKPQFQIIMRPLVEFFGEKEYAGRMNLIFDEVKDLPESRLKYIVKDFLDTRSIYKPPMPRDFTHEAKKYLGNLPITSKSPRENELTSSGETIEQILLKSGNEQAIEAARKFKLIKNENEGA